jgi:uncharacterized protein involved in propanediol utilization
MAAARRLNKPPKSSVKVPKSHDEWHSLMIKALEKAMKVQDPRIKGMQAAASAGQAEAFLRKHHIICLADIQREFQEG